MTSNFLQVGRTVKCGHCDPSLQKIDDVVPGMVCECICHDQLPCGCTAEQHDAFMCCPNNRKPLKKKDLNKLRQKMKPSDFKNQTTASTPPGTWYTGERCPHLHLEDMQAFLPYFIDAEFKKGKSKTGGLAILHVALFLDWCKKNVKIKK